MKKTQIVAKSKEETIEIAKKLAKYLKKGDTIILNRRIRKWKDKICRRIFKLL